jgi:hypothetical protein
MADVMTKFKRDELLPESETVLTERIRLVLNPMEGGLADEEVEVH